MLHKRCPNTEFSPVRMQEKTDQKKTPYLDIFYAVSLWLIIQKVEALKNFAKCSKLNHSIKTKKTQKNKNKIKNDLQKCIM